MDIAFLHLRSNFFHMEISWFRMGRASGRREIVCTACVKIRIIYKSEIAHIIIYPSFIALVVYAPLKKTLQIKRCKQKYQQEPKEIAWNIYAIFEIRMVCLQFLQSFCALSKGDGWSGGLDIALHSILHAWIESNQPYENRNKNLFIPRLQCMQIERNICRNFGFTTDLCIKFMRTTRWLLVISFCVIVCTLPLPAILNRSFGVWNRFSIDLANLYFFLSPLVFFLVSGGIVNFLWDSNIDYILIKREITVRGINSCQR